MAKKENNEQPREQASEEFINEPTMPVEEEYLQVSQQAAVRQVEMPKEGEGGNGHKSLSEAMDEATDLTDMQFAAARLFPKNYSRRDAMVARIAPDAFLALLHIMVTDRVMSSNPSKPINVNDEIFDAYYMLTTGLDGRGRIDFAELLGAAKEIKKEEQLLKGL
jgi:hypothetical protein